MSDELQKYVEAGPFEVVMAKLEEILIRLERLETKTDEVLARLERIERELRECDRD